MFKWIKDKLGIKDKEEKLKEEGLGEEGGGDFGTSEIKDAAETKKTEVKEQAKDKVEEVETKAEIQKEKIENKAEDKISKSSKQAKEFGEKVEDRLEEIKEETEVVSEVIKEEVKEKVEDVKESAFLGKEIIKDDIKEAKEDAEIVSEIIEEEFKEKEKEVEQDLADKADKISEESKKFSKKAEEKIEEVKEEAEVISEVVKEEVEEKVEDAKENAFLAKEIIKDDIKEAKEEAEIVSEIIEEEVEEKPKKKGFFEKLMDGLTKTRDQMTDKIDDILASYHKIDEDLFMDLEEALVTADVGVNTTMELIDRLQETVKKQRVSNPAEVKGLLKAEIKKLMNESIEDNSLNIEPSPAVILVVGVNGVGKTTTIGKLANSFRQDGKKVLMAAGDTFRAAAIEQLEEWSSRSNVDIISHSEGADPGAVIYDGIHAAKARKSDILICDTAGRLHNKSNLMNELGKIFKIVDREYPEATKEVLLVLDATTGQNAINQAKQFKEVANITGVALTKLDGTAKGGVVIALQAELGLPVKLVGVGEGIDDLQPFNTDDFVDAIFN